MITRFAPSPTGPLHLGHAYAARIAHDLARKAGGTFLLRIEDLDQSRSKPQWETAIFEDLRWLGLPWQGAVMRQSTRAQAYQQALAQLQAHDLIYPCRCKRADIQAAVSAPQEGQPIHGPDGLIYPGTCRGRRMEEAGPGDVLRLDMRKALTLIGSVKTLSFQELGPIHEGEHIFEPDHFLDRIGDVVLARRGMGSSYHLSVVVDDAAQGITLVTRGADLFEATPLHRVLQCLLGMQRPEYHHHALIRDEAGKRLAKRDDARALSAYRAAGVSPEALWSLCDSAGKRVSSPPRT